ncbi:MAG: N-acyl-D-glucosamine 2-epimerase, partial [Leptolyngbya sp. SIO3F4]|nr:N-acyl-D-glucosamine 2-epimerase [Leptolyngbya sp. SIO3F4]
NFAKANADRLLAEAYHAEVGSWTTSPYLDNDGNVIRDLDKKWWVYAELDQTAGALSLENPSYVDKYLRFTNNWWLDNMVDETHHGVWNLLSWPELENILPKQYPWKNGFHTYEHALVGYITSEVHLTGKVKLYFARQQGEESEVVRPYYHAGEIESLNVEPMPPLVGDDNLPSIPGLNRVAVVFTQVE